MIEKKHTALASIYLINDAIASNLAMLTAWFLRFNVEIIPVTKGAQGFATYIHVLPVVTVVFPLAFAVQGLYRVRPARSRLLPGLDARRPTLVSIHQQDHSLALWYTQRA